MTPDPSNLPAATDPEQGESTGLPDALLWLLTSGLLVLGLLTPLGIMAQEQPSVADLYQTHCASCHGADRLGGQGPALIPDNFERLSQEQARQVIAQGRAATQMPAFADKLSPPQIDALTALAFSQPDQVPAWGLKEMVRSHQTLLDPASLPAKPVHDADPLNLFVVVELGDHQMTILDGDRLTPLTRLPTHRALHGGPKFSPDGRFVYFASRDGWISKFDLYSLKYLAEIRAGINSRNLAVSADGRYVLVGNYLPHTLVLLDAQDLRPIRVIPVKDDERSSRVSAVYDAAPRRSFIAALKDIPEVWEIPYSDNPLPVYNGPMHDYRMGEGVAQEQSRFPVRRIRLGDYLDDFFFSQDYRLLLGAARTAKNGQVVNLDARQKIADLDLGGMPHLGSGITFDYQGRQVLASPNLKQSEISIIDMETWKTIKRIPTLGPGFFMRSHEKTPYAWVDVSMGKDKDAMHLLDKRSLEIAATLRPMPGKTASHVEFDRYGKYALLSISELDGALIVYDAASLEEVKRIPMKKPSGKYNVHNKITRSAGTSH